MIVRNEEANLPACLASAEGVFDEVVVVDTGSTDRTREIARSSGARVFEFAWIDDFAAARNAALGHATGDYAFWLDADDRIESSERGKLTALLDSLSGRELAYVVRCACDPGPGETGVTVVDHMRLFPLRPDVRWTYRVHEQILPSLRRAGIGIRWTDVVVRHTGYAEPGLRRRKLGRDLKILEAERREHPDEPFVLFNLGQVSLDLGDTRSALTHLQRSLDRSAAGDSITRKLYALISVCHQRLGNAGSALSVCESGLAAVGDDAELLFRKGLLHRLRGEGSEAEGCWRRVLTLKRPDSFSSVDTGIFGHQTRRQLASLAEEKGDLDGAARLWSEVLTERPGDREASAACTRLAEHVSRLV
jgi:hypothetical protein